MTILVTGATGLIGREFLRLAGPEADIVALGRDDVPAADRDGADWLAVDLCERDFARRLPGRIDAVVHLAQSRGYRAFPEAAVDMADVNLAATTRLLDHARRAGAQRFVFASSATIYAPSHFPLDEDAPIRCTSFYAASKRAAELVIEQYGELMACWALRFFTVYGARQREMLIADLIRRVQSGEPVTVQGRSGLPLSPIHAADVARVLWQVAAPVAPAAPGYTVLNVGGPEALGIRELAEEIALATGAEARLVFSGGEDPPGWVAERTRFERLFPLAQPVPFADGIRRTIAGAEHARR